MFKAVLKINHKGCWGSEIGLKYPENEFSSIDVRWINESVAHILKICGKKENFKKIHDYLNKRKDIINIEILSKTDEELYIRTVTRNVSSHPSFSNNFFELGCFPISPTIFNDRFEIWTIGSYDRDSLTNAYEMIKSKYECKLAYLKEDRLTPRLTEKQRHAFTNAKYFGYYEWPRKRSASDIAKLLGMTKTVFFSHLRKAEMKLLNFIE
jgi:predicted DNA binding protein